jgi:putative ABC transport system permease protein
MSTTHDIKPPKWPLKLLRFFVKKEYIEEIEGDMEEIFYDNVDEHSAVKARRIYTWEMIGLLRPGIVKRLRAFEMINPYPMYKNYFKTSIRSLLKNPMTSFINVFGLAVAIGICLVVYTFMEYDRSIDQFHTHKHKVYLSTFFADRDGTQQQYGLTPRPVSEMLKEDFPSISKLCRVEDGHVVIKYGEHVFHEPVRYADEEFLQMFTFPLKWGASSSLADLNSIVLSNEMSKKYFGDENPVGRDVLIIFGEGNKKTFTVTGVAEEFPKTYNISFNFLINFDNIKISDPKYDMQDWSTFLAATLVEVENPEDVKHIEQGMEKYITSQNAAQPDWAIQSFVLEPIATLHSRVANIKNAIAYDGNVEGRIGMPVIAIFMILLACFNYINMAIVSAAKRLKEIGVRKVIGANRGRVIVQFLSENVVVTFFALVLGCLLCVFIFMPWFVSFSGWPLEVHLFDANLWIFLVVILLVTGIISGFYPALYISKFEAVKIFKGSLTFGRKNPLTKVFLGVQLVLACITITTGVVFTQNNSYQNNRSWGYNQKETLFVPVPDRAAFDKLNASLEQQPNVVSISGSEHHLGKTHANAIIHLPSSKQYEVDQFGVDANYFNTMGIEILHGRGFRERSASDKQVALVNELFVKNLNFNNPIGQQFEVDSVKYEIVGVVKDFHDRNLFIEAHPTIFTLAEEDDFRFISLRVKDGSQFDAHKVIQSRWAALYPEIPFQGGYQESVWADYFFYVDRSQIFNNVIATIAVLLASLGLYGLVTLNVSGRVREFSIRKTLGAELRNIAAIIIKQYVPLTTIAILFGAPLSYVFAKAYLDMLFAYPMPMSISGIVIAVIILIIVLLAVVSTQVFKVSKADPVNGLKVE